MIALVYQPNFFCLDLVSSFSFLVFRFQSHSTPELKLIPSPLDFAMLCAAVECLADAHSASSFGRCDSWFSLFFRCLRCLNSAAFTPQSPFVSIFIVDCGVSLWRRIILLTRLPSMKRARERRRLLSPAFSLQSVHVLADCCIRRRCILLSNSARLLRRILIWKKKLDQVCCRR